MQQCWSTCSNDRSANDHLPKLDHRLPCSSCFQPIENCLIIRKDLDRHSSHPMLVPDAEQRENFRRPTESFETESGFGNGLSPTTTSWTMGVSEFSSGPSSFVDDVEQCSISDQFDQQIQENDHLDDLDERDDFEVLSFDAPPESSLFIKGKTMNFIFISSRNIFRIQTFDNRQSKSSLSLL